MRQGTRQGHRWGATVAPAGGGVLHCMRTACHLPLAHQSQFSNEISQFLFGFQILMPRLAAYYCYPSGHVFSTRSCSVPSETRLPFNQQCAPRKGPPALAGDLNLRQHQRAWKGTRRVPLLNGQPVGPVRIP